MIDRSIHSSGSDAGSIPRPPGTSLFEASVVLDVLLDARLRTAEAWERDRIDELLAPLSRRRLMTPNEVIETMDALEVLDASHVRRPGHA